VKPFDHLATLAGDWTGTNRVQPAPTDPVNESASQLTISPILGGTFLRIDQEWSWNDTPQSGSLLIGYLPKQELATIHWIDTWHNGRGSMALTGRFADDGIKLTALGSFSVDTGPDWGWRIELQLTDADELTINMFCINPANAKDEGWVWSEYTRS
jgi:hypothetical protein